MARWNGECDIVRKVGSCIWTPQPRREMDWEKGSGEEEREKGREGTGGNLARGRQEWEN